MIRTCFTWFPIGGLGEPNIYHDSVCFTRMCDYTWRVSDCEELVGYLMEHQEEMRLTTLCIDGWTGCWLAGEPKDQLPILSG